MGNSGTHIHDSNLYSNKTFFIWAHRTLLVKKNVEARFLSDTFELKICPLHCFPYVCTGKPYVCNNQLKSSIPTLTDDSSDGPEVAYTDSEKDNALNDFFILNHTLT